MNHRILGVVLGGGRSSRMGRDKALLKLPDGRTLVQQATERLGRVCEEVCLSSANDYPELQIRIIPDALPPTRPNPKRQRGTRTAPSGPVLGIATTLRLAVDESFDAILVTPVDMPLLTVDDLRTLRHHWSSRRELPLVGAERTSGRVQPLVALYPAVLLGALTELALSGDRSLVRWLQTIGHRRIDLPETSCRNVNTPEDYNDVLQAS